MKGAHGFEQAYNAQAVVDADSQVIVGEGLTNAGTDKQQVESMVAEVEAQTGRAPRELSADSGCCSEGNLAPLAVGDVTGGPEQEVAVGTEGGGLLVLDRAGKRLAEQSVPGYVAALGLDNGGRPGPSEIVAALKSGRVTRWSCGGLP
jgi:hypothetical protein